MPITEINGISLYTSPLLTNFPNLIQGFTTRKGGVSTGCYESLSMSPRRGDDINCVRKNEQILCSALGLDIKRLTSTRQEHTANIKTVTQNEIGYGIASDWGEGVDGCITTLKNVPLLCYSADCVPLLFYASEIKAIGAVHSGWRGTALAISEKTVQKLCDMGEKPENIFVSVGPCIGKCCYEVSEDVALNFSSDCFTKKADGKYMLDLALANKLLLINAGVPAENIEISGICTKCNNDLFFSHRGQNGKSGTLGGIICISE